MTTETTPKPAGPQFIGLADIDNRIAGLHAEYQAGEEQLRIFEKRAGELKATLIRISGAITVLQELREGLVS